MSSSSSYRDPSEHFHLHYSESDDRSFQIRGRTIFVIIIILSILLLISLLLLYARWISAASTPHRPPHPPPQGLDAAVIDSFPVRSAAGLKDSECCICLALFEDGERMKVLPNCSHCFHSDCVDRWLTARSSCPLCRSSLRVDSPL